MAYFIYAHIHVSYLDYTFWVDMKHVRERRIVEMKKNIEKVKS